jgi:hypothetical protein
MGLNGILVGINHAMDMSLSKFEMDCLLDQVVGGLWFFRRRPNQTKPLCFPPVVDALFKYSGSRLPVIIFTFI